MECSSEVQMLTDSCNWLKLLLQQETAVWNVMKWCDVNWVDKWLCSVLESIKDWKEFKILVPFEGMIL